MITPIDVEEKKDDFETIREKYLRQQKWKYTCDNPLSIWLWEKTVEGKKYRLPTNLAYDFEKYIHVYEEDEVLICQA